MWLFVYLFIKIAIICSRTAAFLQEYSRNIITIKKTKEKVINFPGPYTPYHKLLRLK